MEKRMCLFLLLLLLGLTAGQIDPVDQEALVAVWNGFTDKGSLDWNTAEDLCKRTEFSCSSGKVTRLLLETLGIKGVIATEIGLLTGLKSISIFRNELQSIPTEIGLLQNLTYLYLSYNKLSGTIPTEIGLLTELTYLYLLDNRLSGNLPTEIGRLTKLETLNLNENDLDIALPTEIGSMTSLKQLSISGSILGGTLPTTIGLMSGLTSISLTSSRLGGSIPTEIASLANVKNLVLSSNSLSGQIPSELGSMKSLEMLILKNNRLSGTIPTELGVTVKSTMDLLGTNHLCPLVDYSGWAQFTDFPSYNPTCEACAASFELCPSGFFCVGGVNETFACTDKHCQATTEGNAQWPSVGASQTASGECQAGFSGNPTRLCSSNGVYEAIQNPCTALQCPASQEGNAAWALTNALTTANGTCLTGYRGSPSRTCDASGAWSAIVNPCALIQCASELAGFASWPLTNALATATGTCGSNYTGTPTRTCSATGEWLTIQSPCTPLASPTPPSGGTLPPAPTDVASLPVVQATLRLTNLDYAWFSSSEQNAQTFLSALIAHFAQLLGVPESSIAIVSVTEGSVVVKFDVRTADPDAGKAKLEDFIDSPDLSFLSGLPEEAKEDPSQEVGLDKAASGAQVGMPDPTEAPRNKSNTGAIVGGVVGGLVGLALIGAIAFLVARKMRAGSSKDHELSKVSSSSSTR